MLWKYGLRRGRSSEANKKIERHKRNRVPCRSEPVKAKNWEVFKKWHETQESSYGTHEEDPCCQEDGTPHCWEHPSRRGGRGIIKLWGLLVLLSLPRNGITNPCLKGYQNVKYGRTTAQAFATNTHINAGCYEPRKLETCTIGEKSYWVATNSEMGGWALRNSQFCPRGQPFLCFTKGRMWGC